MKIYDKNGIQLYKEDNIDSLWKLQPQSVDIAVTSPPYNFQKKYATYEDDKPQEAYLAWMLDYGQAVKRLLKPNGSFFLNMGNKPTSPWTAIDVANEMRKEFVLQNTIIWVKAISVEVPKEGGARETLSVGHYKPLNTPRFLNDCWEYIFHLTLSGENKIDRLALGVPYTDKNNLKRWKSGAGGTGAERAEGSADRRDRGNLWFIPYETTNSARPHPAVFPVNLPKWCIRLHGFSSDTVVLDPFMGIGSTAVAAKQLGVKCIGFDIEDEYLSQSSENVDKAFYGQTQN